MSLIANMYRKRKKTEVELDKSLFSLKKWTKESVGKGEKLALALKKALELT